MKTLKYIALTTIIISLSCSSENVGNDRELILSSMLKSQEYWNSGELENFMHNYWKSDSLMFIGKSGITYGWQGSLDRYLNSYPDKASRGILKFDFIDLQPVEDNHYFQVGKYTLYRENDTLSGHFTLLWEKIDGEWRIVVDHSS